MRWKVNAANKAEWHRWFAWHPIKKEGTYVWLEYVYRKGTKASYGWDYDYNIKDEEKGAK